MTAHHNDEGRTAAEIAAIAGVEDTDRYQRQNRRFLHLLERGVEPGAWVAVEHDLVDAAQIPSGAQRRDLTAEIGAMENHPELRGVIDAACGATADLDRIEELGGRVDSHDEERTVISVVVEGRRAWPEVLGGAAPRAEIERRFTIHVRRAPWRDRKNRRVTRVEVCATEIHPDPSESDL